MTIAIIGAGAAGLMAAATALESSPNARIILFERNNRVGKKVMISGGGRCNVTTGIEDVRTVLKKYPRGNPFLTKAMYAFPPAAVRAWFEERGVPLKTEQDLRVFPVSDVGEDVVRVFERLFAESNVDVRLNTSVVAVEKKDDQFVLTIKNGDPVMADRLIITTGGQAYRHTGSTGDGYAFALSLGHTITPLAASLNSFVTLETWPKEISGVSFEDAIISADRPVGAHYRGPFLFTHKGVSGPAVFAVSSLVAFETYDVSHPLRITIDLFPERTLPQVEEDILTRLTANPKKATVNALAGLVPKSLLDIMVGLLDWGHERPAHTISKSKAHAAALFLKKLPLQAVGRGVGDEFVTAGGVSLSEVDPATMESRICPGLFFAGEVLDVDGFTGGFNLQASWAAGRLAGTHAVTDR